MRCSINSSGDRPLMAPALLNPTAEGKGERQGGARGYEGAGEPPAWLTHLSKACSSSSVASKNVET